MKPNEEFTEEKTSRKSFKSKSSAEKMDDKSLEFFKRLPSYLKYYKQNRGEQPVSIFQIAGYMLNKSNLTSYISIDENQTVSANLIKPILTWLQEIEPLFIKRDQTLQKTNKEEALSNPVKVLFGLALLEPELRIYLDQNGSFMKIVEAIEEPIEELLTEKGYGLYHNSFDSVPNLTDEPLEDVAQDMLGRAAFARYLVRRITTTEFHSGAYSIHLCGPWGSGKSTILNFIKKELNVSEEDKDVIKTEQKTTQEPQTNEEKEQSIWIVAEFNAWRNQHINPPWWPLYVNMYNEMKKKFNIFKRIDEWYWRLSAGRLGYVIFWVIIFWLLAIAFPFFNVKNTPTAWAGIADEISKIVALITTLAGGVIAFTQSLGSAQAAKSFEESAQNPMNAIRERFKKHLNWLPKNVRLAVLVDDADRCTSEYVVALLEGIQTLYRQGNIVFIIAADKKWINACFEEKYANLSKLIKEPGKSLGTLFLEKTFQLCTPVPKMPTELKKDLWRELISLKPEKIMSNVGQVKKEAHNSIKDTKEDSTLIKKVEDSRGRPIHEQIAIRSEVVVHLASPGVLQRIEHTLKPCAILLDDNPRAMKRFVNAYSVNRALSTLSFADIELNDLAQWTILSMRWPLLVEYLSADPELVNKIRLDDLTGIDDTIVQLIKSDEGNIIKKVINDSEEIGFGPLTREIVEKCGMLI